MENVLQSVAEKESRYKTTEVHKDIDVDVDLIGGPQATNVPFVVVRFAVSATVDMGVGYSGLVKLCRFFDMPAMRHTTNITHQKTITDAAMQVANDVVCESAKIVRNVYKELDPILDESGDMDLMVSFDGSWMTRGHSSLYDIGCIGLVIDFTILSLYCHSCACAASHYGGRDTDGFKKCFEGHNDSTVNYTGSSNAMEKTAAEILWKNSIDKHGFRYTSVLSDGDASTYKHLCGLNVYGEDVAKRMGTALRNLAKDTKKSGVTLGGRGHGEHKGCHHQTDIILWQGDPQLHREQGCHEECSLCIFFPCCVHRRRAASQPLSDRHQQLVLFPEGPC